MAKSFKNNNPNDRLTKPVSVLDESPKIAVEPKEKKRVGRPKVKTEETKTINIAVPVSVLEKLDTVKICYNNNLTLYINKLIEKDIESNYEKYSEIANSLNKFKWF